jgi:chromosome segregation ATPase
MLENERKKFREAKERFENDLDNERKKRIEFENKLIRLKDEYSRKEVTVSESEFKINNLLHQNQDLAVENDKLKHELARMEEIYGGKIH